MVLHFDLEVDVKALVTYYSESGNTRKVAEAVFAGLKAKDKSIMEISEVSKIEGFDIIFCGFPVIEHSVPTKMQAFLKRMPAGSKLAFFATHGVQRGGAKAITAFETAGSLVQSSKVLGTFGVRGEVKDAVIEAHEDNLVHQSWTEEAVTATGHPNDADLEDATAFANKILEKIKYQAA